MPSYNRNYLYDSVIIALLAETLDRGEKISLNSIVDEVGFSKTTIIHTIRRLIGQNRISVGRNGRGRGATLNYQIKTQPTEIEKQNLHIQREIKKAASDSLAA